MIRPTLSESAPALPTGTEVTPAGPLPAGPARPGPRALASAAPVLSITVAVLQPGTEPPPLGIWGGLSPIDLLPWAMAVVILIDLAVLASYLSRRRRRNPTPGVQGAPPPQEVPLRAQERMQRLPVIPPHATEADLARLEEEYRQRNADPDDDPPPTRPASWYDHPAAWNED